MSFTPDKSMVRKQSQGGKKSKPKKPADDKPKSPRKYTKRKPRARKDSHSEPAVNEDEREARQCFGPRCRLAARSGSKYCSDECGKALAVKRLSLLLPQRVQDYYGQAPLWKVETEEKIQKLRLLQNETEEALKRVDDCAQNLELYFGTLSSGKPSTLRSSQSEDDGALQHGCMICGLEVPVKALPRHIQRCFVRTEKQSTFGTAQKFGINPHNIMCEKYDKQTKTYCKRLRVICSEHYRDEIGNNFKLCGYPLAWTRMNSHAMEEMFLNMDILADGMCLSARKNCDQHLMWEQAASAVVENQRMQLLLKMDEIADSYKRLAETHSVQRNAITLLMNSRQQHESLVPDVADKVGRARAVKVFKDEDQEMLIDVDSVGELPTQFAHMNVVR